MSSNVLLNPGVGGKTVRTDEIGGAQYELVKLTLGVLGVDDGPVSATNPLPVLGPLTDAELRATPVPVSGTVATGGLTDAQLRASAVPVSAAALPLPAGAATDAGLSAIYTRQADGSQHAIVDNFPATQPISAVSLPLPTGASTSALQTTGNTSLASIDSKLTAPITVTGPLTDTQLRATPVPVSGTVTTGGLTDAQLRATAVPVSAASLPLPAGAATSALQTTGNTSLASIDGKLPAALIGGRLDENVGAWLGSTAPTVGSKTSANSVPVVIASDQASIPVTVAGGAATAARTSPTVTNVVSTVLAANASRKGAAFYHDGTGNVFLALGSGATTTDFTTRLQANDYYEVLPGYTGIITAIRSSGTSSLRVTELT
jgi:hypothetical protein